MLLTLVLGGATLLVCLAIQLLAVILAMRRVARRTTGASLGNSFMTDFMVLGEVLVVLVLGNVVQVSIWAWLFLVLDEFEAFSTAFYHSMVNFATLGYGDIVMSEQWRLLGAFEAGGGVTMFGLTTGAVMATLGRVLQQRARDQGLTGLD